MSRSSFGQKKIFAHFKSHTVETHQCPSMYQSGMHEKGLAFRDGCDGVDSESQGAIPEKSQVLLRPVLSV